MKKHNTVNIIPFYFISIIIVILPLVLYFCNFNGSISSNSTEWSNFGTFFGGIASSLLNLITTFLVIRTLLVQQESLRLQNEEYNTSLRNMTESNSNTKKQIDNIEIQTFEKTFYNMINQRINMIELFSDNSKTGFQKYIEDINKIIKMEIISTSDANGIKWINNIQDKKIIDEICFIKYIGFLNFLIGIADLIENNTVISNKEHYYNIYRNSLSEYELKLLIISISKQEMKETVKEKILKILGVYYQITLEDLQKNWNRSLYQIAIDKDIFGYISY